MHTGQVVLGPLGDTQRLLALAVGDTMQLAERLRHLAAPGTLLLSAATRQLVQGMLRLETVELAPASGPLAPVLAYRVLGVKREALPWQRGCTVSPLVGRERQMAVLQTVLAQVEDGRGQVVGIVGEPGMGKSRLLDEFRRQGTARRLTYMTGGCVSYGSATPYLPLLACLRQAWGIAATDSPEAISARVYGGLRRREMAPEAWAPGLLAFLGVEAATAQLSALSPQERRAQTFEALLQLCLHASRPRPLVLASENLHWIDPTAEEWLLRLVERLAGVPLLLLVTYRPGYRSPWIDKSYATQLVLPRLTPPDSRRVIHAHLSPAPAPETLVQRLIATADGNPFFLEELAGLVREHDDHTTPVALPDTIQALLAARLDHLSPAAKHLVQLAAVIGKEVPAALLQAVLALPDATRSRSLVEIQAAEVLYERPGRLASIYTFKHAIMQEAAYQSLLRRTRQYYHQQIAQVLEAQFPETGETQPEVLAQHYTAAGLGEQAVGYWQRAGQQAVERSAHLEAVSHLTQGLEVLQTLLDTPERAHHELVLQITLGSALVATKGLAASEVEPVYRRAQALCQQVGDTSQLFRVLRGLQDARALLADLA